MIKLKEWMLLTAILLSALIFCACYKAPLYEGRMPLTEATSETKITEISSSVVKYRRSHFYMNSFDHSQVMQFCAFADRDNTGLINNERKPAVLVQSSLNGIELLMSCSFLNIFALRSKRISILALSLGGNSPPV